VNAGNGEAATPLVSVVVPTRDRATRLRRLLAALEAQTLDLTHFEVIVVDNGSLDGTPALLEEAVASSPLSLRTIARTRGEGPAAARNDGWRAAKASLVAFTDDDCEPAPGWLEESIDASSAAPDAAIQGATIPNPDELRQRMGPFAHTQSIERRGPYFQTCNMLYPRSVLESLGGFDERFTQPAGEDTDLAWRALEGGARIEFAPRALVFHAVEDLGPTGHLKIAARWPDLMYVFRTHPQLRAQVRWRRLFWKQTHFLLAGALIAAALGRRTRLAWLLALPYARHLMERCREARCSPAYAGYFLLHDIVEMGAAARGSLRHRVLFL
jgi:GT2 family glycosyltransferase